MNLINQTAFWLAQIGNRANEAAGGDNGGAGEQEGSFWGSLLVFGPAILMVMVVYFLLSGRPQQKQQAKAKELLDSLKKNDRVLTAGGILGTVVQIREDNDYVTLRVDDDSNTRMQVLKTSIVRAIRDEDEGNSGKNSGK